MLSKIHDLSSEEQPIVLKEMRDYIQDMLRRASGMTFNHIRLSKGLSIDELAKSLKISTARLKLIEKGDVLPTSYLTEKLTQLFQLNRKHDSEGKITLTYHEIFFASLQSIMLEDLQGQNLKH